MVSLFLECMKTHITCGQKGQLVREHGLSAATHGTAQ